MSSHELEPHQSSTEVGDKEGTYEQKKLAPQHGGQTVYLVPQKTPATKQKTDKKKKLKKNDPENVIFAH